MFRFLALCIVFCSFSTFAKPVERVVSLAPHATEIAFAAGLGDQLVGVSSHSDYPEEAKNIELVSDYQSINLERIITLQPDLIIAWPGGNPAKELEKLEQFGFEIFYSKVSELDDIAKNILILSKLSSDPSIGQNNAKMFRDTLSELNEKYQTHVPVSYFYQLSESPIITVAKGNWPSEVFEFCGGENVFEDSLTPYPQVGIEQVLIAQPDVIFSSEHAMRDGSMWMNWQDQLPAVQNGHMWSLTSDWLNRPTMRTLKAVEQVCQHFETVRQKR